MKPNCSSRRASALLLVLWALLLLSSMVFGWAAWTQQGIAAHGEANRAAEARAMAHSGLAIALHPLVSRQTQIPEEQVSPGQSFRVRIVGEGGKLNVNWLIRGEDPMKLAILRQWLTRRGLDYEQCSRFMDCLLDYVDADNVKRLNGAEDDGNYHPANRELRSVEELARVAGTAPLTSQPGWQDDLTVYSLGPIDLNAASAEILELLPGIGETRARQFVQFRQGEDGVDGTADDNLFPDIKSIQQFLKLNDGQFQLLAPLVANNDLTLHIISEGRSGNVTRQVETIVRKGAGKPQILSWKE